MQRVGAMKLAPPSPLRGRSGAADPPSGRDLDLPRLNRQRQASFGADFQAKPDRFGSVLQRLVFRRPLTDEPGMAGDSTIQAPSSSRLLVTLNFICASSIGSRSGCQKAVAGEVAAISKSHCLAGRPAAIAARCVRSSAAARRQGVAPVQPVAEARAACAAAVEATSGARAGNPLPWCWPQASALARRPRARPAPRRNRRTRGRFPARVMGQQQPRPRSGRRQSAQSSSSGGGTPVHRRKAPRNVRRLW